MPQFLSDDWIAAAREIRERHAGESPVAVALTLNLTVTDAPFGDGPIKRFIDTTSGQLVIDLGELDGAEVSVTTDYETAKSLFLATDPSVGMQAFMAGKLVVQGDMMKLMALPAMAANDPSAQAAAEEIRAITS